MGSKFKKDAPAGHLTRYARHAGISRQGAAKQLQALGIDYSQKFDFAEVDRLRAGARHADRAAYAAPIPLVDDPELGQGPIKSGSTPPYAASQAEREHWRAKMARLEYFEKAGALVDADKIKKQQFAVAREVRDAMQNIPARVSGVLAAETDQQKVHAILEKEIRQALSGLAEEES